MLKDGTSVLIRPIEPEDKHLIELGFAHLSDRSRYFRFLRPIAKLSDKDLDYFTSVGGPDHVAFGALDLTTETVPIGIARYVRLPGEPTAAEIAVTVADSHQGRCLGSLLIGALAACAVMNDLQTFVALVHASNAPMLRLFMELGATVNATRGTERELRIPLYRDPMHYPRTLVGDAVRRAYALSNYSVT
jgi:GNAT superfamily N-acetyltransferase